MADEATLTAGNGTEGNAAPATGTAEPSATANAAQAASNQANTDTQPPADKAAADKPQGAPETYEYQLPEGVELPQELRGEVDGLFKDLGLTNEQAQRIVDTHLKLMGSSRDSLTEAITAQQEQWAKDLKADKEIGGDKLAQVGATCKALLDQVNVPGLKDALEETGFGNHPAMVRFVYRIAQELGVKEGRIVTSGSGSSSQKDASQILFGSQSNP